MNLPNWLTLIRFFLVPVFLIIIALHLPHGDYIAAFIFLLGAGTDALDGYLARKYNIVTRWGKLMDPLADKMLIAAALISLVELQRLPGWVATVIIARELAVTGLRAFIAVEGTTVPSSYFGKLKTIVQVAAIVSLLLQIEPYGLKVTFANLTMTFALIFTIWSGISYFNRWWCCFKEGEC